MKIQKTLIAAVALALAGSAYAGNDKNKSMTSDQGSSQAATQQQASSDTTLRSAAANGQASASGQMSANGQSSAQAGDESVRQLQQQLKDKGFDPGPIDGIDGPKTQAALRKAQEAGGLNASATSDLSTGSSMSSPNQPSTASSPSSSAPSQPSTEGNATPQPK